MALVMQVVAARRIEKVSNHLQGCDMFTKSAKYHYDVIEKVSNHLQGCDQNAYFDVLNAAGTLKRYPTTYKVATSLMDTIRPSPSMTLKRYPTTYKVATRILNAAILTTLKRYPTTYKVATPA